MARPSNTDERRRQIVHGLLEVMAEHGYDGATIPAIAAAAGLAPGLVHYHFESKLQILVQLVDELSAGLAARYERRSARCQDAWEKLDAFIDAHVALGRDADPRAVACWVVIAAEALQKPELRAVYGSAIGARLDHGTALVRAVLADEARDVARADEIAAALLAAIEGSYQLAVVARAIPRGSAAPMIRRMARGLVSEEAVCR